jgi:hypothetical protein
MSEIKETKDVGGPAFPLDLTVDGDHRWGYGMTLRDYFAAKAMQGFMGSSWNNKTFESISTKAYQIADAMLEERKKS